MNRLELTTDAVAATRAVAARLADLVVAGDVVVLLGDLGAGKTAFVQGLVAALGSPDRVTSPTFTIAQRYDGGRLRVHHLDAYRLAGPDDATDLALEELVEDDAVTLVEWGDRLRGLLPVDHLEVALRLGPGPDDRILVFEAGGPRSAALVDGVAAAC